MLKFDTQPRRFKENVRFLKAYIILERTLRLIKTTNARSSNQFLARSIVIFNLKVRSWTFMKNILLIFDKQLNKNFTNNVAIKLLISIL